MGKQVETEVAIDVNVNMTLTMSPEQWRHFKEDAWNELEGVARRTKKRVEKEAAQAAAEYFLDGEEVLMHDNGRAWICTVDSAAAM